MKIKYFYIHEVWVMGGKYMLIATGFYPQITMHQPCTKHALLFEEHFHIILMIES